MSTDSGFVYAGKTIHYLSGDELTLHSYYDGPDATIEASVGWPDAETARTHHLVAVEAFEARLGDLISQVPASGARRTTLRRRGPVNVATYRPERWWVFPRLHVSREKRRVGVAWGPVGLLVRLRRQE